MTWPPTRAELEDGRLDALALAAAAATGDEEAIGAVLAAYEGLNALPLVVGLLGLVDRLLSETGTDPGEWAGRLREGWRA